MSKAQYPLEQLTLIKKKRLDEAEKVLQEKKELLVKEEKKLKKVEEERDKVKEHKDEKLAQLREELDKGTTSGKIQQMKTYLKEVDGKLAQKEVKVVEQKKQVKAAEEAVEVARKDMLLKQQSVEKMRLHKEEWIKEQKKEEERLAGIETDEIGNTIFAKRRMERKQAEKGAKNG